MPHVQTPDFQPIAALQGNNAPHGRERGAVHRALRDSVAEALGIEAKGRGVHGLATAIRDKLASSEAGADAVPSVLETINRALDDAAGKLAAQGVSQDAIDAAVARFKNKLSRELSELTGGAPASGAPPTSTDQAAIAVRQEVRERLSLDITTTEGDQVSIKFKSLSVTEVAAAKVANDKGSSTAVQGNVISAGRFKVEVDGDLNDAEKTAIANLLDKVNDIATDFFGGDVQAAFNAAARVGLESDALSAFDLKLSYSKSIAVAAYAKTAALADPVKPKSATPVTQPVVTQPVAVTTDPVAVPTVDAVPGTPVVDTVAKLPDPAATAPASEGKTASAAVAHNAAKAASAISTITQFTKDILERLDQDDESKTTKFSLAWKVEFLIKAFGSVALTPSEQAAADALGIALDGQAPAQV